VLYITNSILFVILYHIKFQGYIFTAVTNTLNPQGHMVAMLLSLLTCSLFNNNFGTSDYMVSHSKVIGKSQVGKDVTFMAKV
jgi:hypothetical protein